MSVAPLATRSFALAATVLTLVAGGARAEDYESPPTVPASEVLPPDALKGPHHQVAAEAVGDGVGLSFRITSDFGEFDAPSQQLAMVRVDEVAAIAKLKELGSSEAFAKALAASVENKAKAVANVAKDPGGTAKGVGRGLKRMWGKTKQTAGDVAEKVKEDDAQQEKGEAPSASDAGSELLGLNKAKRQLAQSVGADPYSSNPALQAEFDRLARAMVAGGITGGLGTRIPGIDTVASVGDLAWNLPPEDLRARNEKALLAMGCDDECQKAFFGNPAYTPSLQTGLVLMLEKLDGLAGRADLVALAAGAEDEVEARFYPLSFAVLAAAQGQGRALKDVRAFGRVPAALTADGTLVVGAAADLLAWTEVVSDAADRQVEGASKRELWITGGVTERVRSGLSERGWALHERTPVS